MIRLGLIGAGPNGTGNIKNFALHANRCRLSAVCEPNPEAAAKVAALAEGVSIHAQPDAAFLDACDAVIISSPNWLHADQAVACAQAGKHLWIEKPMALNTTEADRIVAAVEATGVRSFIGFSVRFGAVTQELAQQVRAGLIGTPYSVWSRRLTRWPVNADSWRADFSRSGGVMSELLCHELDWIVSLVGFPKSVYGRIHTRFANHPRMNEHVWMTLAFDGPLTATLEGSQCAPIADFYNGVVGDAGSLYTAHWGSKLMHAPDSKSATELTLGPGFDKHAHFLDVVEGRAESLADVHYGRRLTHLIERALDSAVSGEAQRVDL